MNEVHEDELKQVTKASNTSPASGLLNGVVRNNGTETLLFVPRVVRNGINPPHAFEERKDSTSTVIFIDDADSEGGVPLGESDLNKTVEKSSSLGDGIPPVASRDGIDGGNLESGGHTTNPTTRERDRNDPSTPKTPLFISPASGATAKTTPSKKIYHTLLVECELTFFRRKYIKAQVQKCSSSFRS